MSAPNEPTPTGDASGPRPVVIGESGRRQVIQAIVVPRNTVADTWGWLWKDSLGRVVPFLAAAGLYARLSGQGVGALGLRRGGWAGEVVGGIALGIPMAGIAAWYRGAIARGYRLPTPADQALQSAFYFAANAPAEELFWRATMQRLTIRALGAVPRLRVAASPVGWALTTAAFGAYHRLGGWSWRAIAGVTAMGGLMGALYEWRRPGRRSILLPIIVHGFATAGFLSWGDALLHARAVAQGEHGTEARLQVKAATSRHEAL